MTDKYITKKSISELLKSNHVVFMFPRKKQVRVDGYQLFNLYGVEWSDLELKQFNKHGLNNDNPIIHFRVGWKSQDVSVDIFARDKETAIKAFCLHGQNCINPNLKQIRLEIVK